MTCVPGEELVDVGADDVLEEDEGRAAVRTERLGKRDEARQHVGHLDARELRAAAVADDDREVLAQVRDERERMARVERQRRQHRADLAREVRGQVLADLRRPRILVEERDLFLLRAACAARPTSRLILSMRRARARIASSCCSVL